MSENNTSFLQLFSRKGLPFVVFRLPNTQKLIFIAQKNSTLKEIKISKIDSVIGFLIAGFEQANAGSTYFIRPDILLSDGVLSSKLQNELEALPDIPEMPVSAGHFQTKSAYLKSVQKLIDKLKSGELQKVVLSRVTHSETGMIDKGKLFTKLEQKYPEAFVYLMHLPRMGTWVGATPETLLKLNKGFGKIAALAGTTSADAILWTDKEKEEQQMVTDYIEETLVKEGISDFQKFGPFTLKAGNVAHLKTTFQIPFIQLKGKVGGLITRLHPTPAVCGLPKNKAFDLIQQLEEHDRELYTGFLGPWNLKGKSQLFVNLRCARLEKSAVRIFVGGGITASSNAAAEWEETENKAQTLLSVLKKL